MTEPADKPKTSTTTSPASYARTLLGMWFSRYALWIAAPLAACAIAGFMVDIRWLIVSLMVALLILPSLIAYIYFYYLLSPEAGKIVNMLNIRKMKIHPIDPSHDAPEIADIYNHYVIESTASFEIEPVSTDAMASRLESLTRAEMPALKAVDGAGSIIGYCYAHPWKERAAYCNTLETTIYLTKRAHRHGVGTALMQHLIDDCRRKGVHALIADITGENEASIRFHERLGFTKVSEFKAVGRKFDRWLDVVDLELIINP